MKYTGTIYRPPFEADSLLLQVTQGCSHNKCAFCTMYRDVPFCVETLEQIEADLREAALFYPYETRVFLENGDAFVLEADRLKQICEMIHRHLPHVETITMYASINNVKSKTDAELRELRECGINDLNIGLESGLDAALAMMQKGYNSEEALRQLLRLNDAGIDYCANIILGCAGPELRLEHARASAELLNKVQPFRIFVGTIHADPGCPLYDQLMSGAFIENTFGQYLEEQETFLQCLELQHCHYFGLHPSNVIQMQGMLGRDKAALLNGIAQKRMRMSPEQLASRPLRMGEGAVLNR